MSSDHIHTIICVSLPKEPLSGDHEHIINVWTFVCHAAYYHDYIAINLIQILRNNYATSLPIH